MQSSFSRRSGAALAPFALVALLAAGCGSKGTVTGTVTHNGTPLKGGTIQFIPEDGSQVAGAEIGEDGRYTIEKVPAGKVKVVVETYSLGQKAFATKYAPL